jgi:hypothetical protein
MPSPIRATAAIPFACSRVMTRRSSWRARAAAASTTDGSRDAASGPSGWRLTTSIRTAEAARRQSRMDKRCADLTTKPSEPTSRSTGSSGQSNATGRRTFPLVCPERSPGERHVPASLGALRLSPHTTVSTETVRRDRRPRCGHSRTARCSRPGGGSYDVGHQSVTSVIRPTSTAKNTIAVAAASPSMSTSRRAAPPVASP